MTYITQNDREKFKPLIKEVLVALSDPNDTIYLKGELIGFFLNRCVKRFLADQEYTNPSFNSTFFNETKKKSLINAADSIAASICRSDPIGSGGELSYALSTIIWGFLGKNPAFAEASIGFRYYIIGIIDKIKSSIETSNTGSQKDMTMYFRRHLVIRGCLCDILMETHRRLASDFYDKKMEENGDLF